VSAFAAISPLVLASPWILVLALVVYRYARRQPHLRDYDPVDSGPLLSVIIPARNERHNIETCVRSILAARYSPFEVIVVDDRSSDGTAEVVERFAESPAHAHRLQLVRGRELPEGWFGKQWAMVQGYQAARGDLLLFADADTHHAPELIPRAVAAMAGERADLLSLVPRQEMASFWERLIQPQVFLALQTRVGDLRRVNRTRVAWDAIANGQFILVARTAYAAVGTHEMVKDHVADDVALAQAFVRAGKDIMLVHAPQFMSVRMYRSLGEIVRGWSKNLALGAPLMTPPIAVVRRAIPYLMWLPSLFWILPPLVWAFDWPLALPCAIATGASLLLWMKVYWEERAPLRYALLYPLGAAMVAYIMIRSALRGDRVEWRGRRYLHAKG
jgi:chlorobactene glucosyltransferase